jgi:pyrroloquinoline quinone (PQQ) biosynthesis protein C
VEDDESRSFLIDNIRVEKAHAEHWIWMGMGFGVPKKEMLALAEGNRPVLRDVQSLTDWLWYINTKGSLAEAVAATSFAIEGMAGDIARKVTPGFEAYREHSDVEMGPKTYKWFREHALYDDHHPKIALEIVKRYATTEKMQTRAMVAAKRSIQLLHNALLTAYQAYSPTQTGENRADGDKRGQDRRLAHQVVGFPDRRFNERRGRSRRAVA